jgi:hypothetical protein
VRGGHPDLWSLAQARSTPGRASCTCALPHLSSRSFANCLRPGSAAEGGRWEKKEPLPRLAKIGRLRKTASKTPVNPQSGCPAVLPCGNCHSDTFKIVVT